MKDDTIRKLIRYSNEGDFCWLCKHKMDCEEQCAYTVRPGEDHDQREFEMVRRIADDPETILDAILSDQ